MMGKLVNGQSINFSLSSLPSMSMEGPLLFNDDDCNKYKNEDKYDDDHDDNDITPCYDWYNRGRV